jgi:multidrug transporter EmrE-like cation transporter
MLRFLSSLALNPWVLSCYAAAFLAAICWMAAMTKFDLSYAYPFTSISFILVLLLSAFLFQEAITAAKVIGLVLIIAGIVVASSSS